MEELSTHLIQTLQKGIPVDYTVREKDHGDQVVYDVSWKDHYLFTASRSGEILFMNMEASAEDKELFRLSFLSQFVNTLNKIH